MDENKNLSAVTVHSLDEVVRIGKIFVGSGMFKSDASGSPEQKVYQAIVKITAGAEFGIGPFAAMKGINIINGNTEMSSNLMAGKVKQHPKYDYTVDKWDNDSCTLTFWEIQRPGDPRDKWFKLGESTFNLNDAQTAQLTGSKNYSKFARNMYFARAMSNGVRIFCPDIFYGTPVYTEGEVSDALEQSAGPKIIENEAADRPAEDAAQVAKPGMATAEQLANLKELFEELELYESEDRLGYAVAEIDRAIGNAREMTEDEADKVARKLEDDIAERDARLAGKSEEKIDVNLDDPVTPTGKPAEASADPAAEVLATMTSDGDESFPTLKVKTAPSDLMLAPDIDMTTSEATSFQATDEEKVSIKATVRKLGMTGKGEALYLSHVTGGKSFYANFETGDWYKVKAFTALVVAGKEPLDESWMPKAKGKAAKEAA